MRKSRFFTVYDGDKPKLKIFKGKTGQWIIHFPEYEFSEFSDGKFTKMQTEQEVIFFLFAQGKEIASRFAKWAEK